MTKSTEPETLQSLFAKHSNCLLCLNKTIPIVEINSIKIKTLQLIFKLFLLVDTSPSIHQIFISISKFIFVEGMSVATDIQYTIDIFFLYNWNLCASQALVNLSFLFFMISTAFSLSKPHSNIFSIIEFSSSSALGPFASLIFFVTLFWPIKK